MSSLESALTAARRPGPVELGWRWRWEFAIVSGLAGLAAFVASDAGLIGLAAAAGAGLAAGTALLCLPPARQWMIALAWCLITAQGAGRLRERLGADQERQAAHHPGHGGRVLDSA